MNNIYTGASQSDRHTKQNMSFDSWKKKEKEIPTLKSGAIEEDQYMWSWDQREL